MEPRPLEDPRLLRTDYQPSHSPVDCERRERVRRGCHILPHDIGRGTLDVQQQQQRDSFLETQARAEALLRDSSSNGLNLRTRNKNPATGATTAVTGQYTHLQ